MTDIESQTISLCPFCFRRIPAQRIVKDRALYLRKSCPEHGAIEDVLLWKDEPLSYRQWARPHADSSAPFAIPSQNGCPYDCGLCSGHKQKTCTAIIEVTHRCNLGCPVCFAASESRSESDPEINQIMQILEMLRDRTRRCPIQLSGGEPTLRDDLPEIIARAKTMGFDPIQVNTNGIRLAQDADYARALSKAGASVLYLQFDGLKDSTYRRIRGADLLALKLQAVERCAELKLGLILVPTLVKNVNDGEIGAIIQFAKKWMPVVKGVHFQPMTYLGRYPTSPSNEDRLLIPDILNAIEEQTAGELKFENFIPSG
jgi:7,8-dihydro-6-hydroxymethylpterin dimethyltransferase